MLKKMLLMLAAVVFAMPLCAVASDLIDSEVKDPVEIYDVDYSEEQLDSEDAVSMYYNQVGTVRLQFSRGALSVSYRECRMDRDYEYIPEVYLDCNGVLHIEWEKRIAYFDCTTHYLMNMSFKVRHSGDVSVSNSVCDNPLNYNGKSRYVNFAAEEGLDITIPIDRSQSLFPVCRDSQVWLYGYAKWDGLTGRYATVCHTHGSDLTAACEIRRCESDVFDENNSRLMGYVRNDGLRHYVTPVNDDLPYDMWVDGMEGSFNPWEMTGGKEFTPYEFYPEKGVFVTRDFVLDNFKVFEIRDHADEKQECLVGQRNISSPYSGGVVRHIILGEGVHAREDIGMYGLCGNDLLYPTMAGEGKAQLRLICSYYQKGDNKYMIYTDPIFYPQYRKSLAEIDASVSVTDEKLEYVDPEVRFSCGDECSLAIYSVEGRCVNSVAGSGVLCIDITKYPSGIYIAKGEHDGKCVTKTICVK